MYAHGGGAAVPLSVFSDPNYVPASTYTTWKSFTDVAQPSYNYVFLFENNNERAGYPATQGLWYALDKYGI
jgi:hypothetical protein